MVWKCVCAETDVLCYQKTRKNYAVRIEARQTDEGWEIHKSYFNDQDLNVTETFEAKDRNEMESLLNVLQSQRDPTLKDLKERMLSKKKSIKVKLQRAYKEYNVEKWHFRVNDTKHPNFLVIRFYDLTEVDIVMHESLSKYERAISKELMRVLGLHGVDEELVVRFYYFKSSSAVQRQDKVPKPQAEVFGWFNE